MTGRTEQNGFMNGIDFNPRLIERVDKLDLLLRMPEDLAKQYLEAFTDLANACAQENEERANFHIHSMGFDATRKNRIYIFETWGLFSHHLLNYLPTHYYKFISRIDYNLELDVDVNKFGAIERIWRDNNTRKRNITTYDSKIREKKEQRDAGGRGIALGSHGSDNRLTIYKRGTERGTIEFQFRGKSVQNIQDGRRAIMRAKPELDASEAMLHALRNQARLFANETMRMNLEEVVTSALDEGDYFLEHMQTREATGVIAMAWEKASPIERMELLAQCGIKLSEVLDAFGIADWKATP